MKNKMAHRVVMSLLMLVAMAVAACNNDIPVIDTTQEQRPDYRKNAVQANRYLIEREETNINSYIERRGWQVRILDCGARLHEYSKGKGELIGNGDTVTMQFSVKTLSDKLLYCDSVMTFVVGKLEPCEGVDAAVRSLHRGGKAHVVLPSSVGFGVVGDHDRIPPRTPLVYDIEIRQNHRQ